MNPPVAENFRSWNEKFAHEYDVETYLRNLPWPLRLMELLRYRILAREAQRAKAGPFLDAGCGSGHLLVRLLASGISSIGADLSDTNIKRCRAALPDVPLVHADVLSLPFRSRSLGGIACTEVIEHLPHPEEALRELARALCPGGIFLVTVPNDALITRAKRWIECLPGLTRILGLNRGGPSRDGSNLWHLHVFGRDEFEVMLRHHYDVERTITLPFRALPLRWIFIARRKPVPITD